MSATLTWANSGNGVKTNTTLQALFDDLDTLVTSKSGDATFTWQTAGKNSSGATPFYYVLSPKGGGNGRILFVCWTSAPAANNAAILDQAPTANAIYVAYFPNGTANTPSNLTAASGTIMGNDSACTKLSGAVNFSTMYAASIVPFYFDSAEGCVFGWANPAATTMYTYIAGNLVVDAADVAYPCVCFNAAWGGGGFGANVMPWAATAPLAGTTSVGVKSNYGATGNVFYQAFLPGSWQAATAGSTDILTDNSSNKAWFVPYQLVGNTKGQGFALKFRQFGFGPAITTAFPVYNITGPVVAARAFSNTTVGVPGVPWFTNFKI